MRVDAENISPEDRLLIRGELYGAYVVVTYTRFKRCERNSEILSLLLSAPALSWEGVLAQYPLVELNSQVGWLLDFVYSMQPGADRPEGVLPSIGSLRSSEALDLVSENRDVLAGAYDMWEADLPQFAVDPATRLANDPSDDSRYRALLAVCEENRWALRDGQKDLDMLAEKLGSV